MPREFKLPDVGEGVAEGEIVEWLVEVGDPVTEDQPVAEVETDKAVVEVPSPVNGTVREIRAEAGEVVPVGDVIIVFDVEGEEEPPVEEPTDEAAPADDAAEPAPAEAGGGNGADGEGRVFAPPHVRRLARELGVELAAVSGSGPGGRITEGDVRAAAENGAEPAVGDDGASEPEPAETGAGEADADAGTDATGAAEADTEAAAADRDRTLAAPATRQLARELGVDIDAVPATEERDGEAFVTPEAVEAFAERGGAAAEPGGAEAETAAGTEAGAAGAVAGGERTEERVPYRGLRRTIGQRMSESAFTVPHVTHHDEADAEELVRVRNELKLEAEERGIRLTYMPFVMKAVVGALKEYPRFNATLDEEAEEIVEKRYYNIGVATATDDGLLVPVVEDVDRKGLLQLASEINELAEKARDRSIAREEMQGGTFTITNYGAIGGEYGTPIINYPEVGILGLGAIEQRARVVDGEVVPRYTVPISLSFDHRVADGAMAGRFANRLMEYLENPALLLLE